MSTKASPEPKAAAPAPKSFTPARSLVVQRKCACGGSAGASGECGECRDHKLMIQRSASNHSAIGNVPSAVHSVLSSSGRPLDTGTRSFMEDRFGQDFGGVRIHDDAQAAESARAVNAHAYTVGQDVVFDAGQYAPDSSRGRHLLAHELAHTVQQRGLQRHSAIATPSAGEDQRLEAEAESIAGSVINGGHTTEARRANAPVLSRAKKGVKKDVPGLKYLQVESDADPLGHDVYEVVEAFPLPAEKGPVELKWDTIAKGGGLRSSLDLRKDPKVDVKQDRPELREAWLGKVGWPTTEADTRWSGLAAPVLKKTPVAGKLVEAFPRVNDVACHMDHIVELQVFGGNEKENLQVLDPSPNMSSGSQIRGYLSEVSERIKTTLGADAPDGVLLIWRSAKQVGAAICGPCVQIEQAAANGIAAGPDAPTSKGLAVNRQAVSWMGKQSEILIPKDEKEPTIPLAESTIVENRSVSRLISGLSLSHYHHKKPAIDAVFDPNARLPFQLEKKKGKPDQIKVAVASDGALSVVSGKIAQPIFYDKLSEGVIDHVKQEGDHLAGSGTITPSIPLLKPMGKLGFDFSPNSLAITKSLDPKKAKLPIPGVTITEAKLGLELFPKFGATGGLKFKAMAGKTPLLDGDLSFTGDESGFGAKGHISAHVPGVDKADGDITYSQGQWSGGITVESTQLKNKFKFVTGGSFTIGFSQAGGIVAQGKVSLDLPHTENVEMGLKLTGAGWLLHGKGIVKVPRLKPIGIEITYDGTTLQGIVSPGPKFELLGFTGGIETLRYRNGRVSGTGSLEFKKGKAQGKLTINRLESGAFTGRGDLSYQLSENLLVSGSAELDEKEKLHLAGTLKYLKPIELPHTKFGGVKTLFQAGISIPIPGLSLGPAVGLKARIEGELMAGFSVGPAQIRNIELTGKFDPLEENPNFEVGGTAEFFMPGNAHIDGKISAGVMLDLFIGDVTGGLTVRVSADLDGNFKATVKASYSLKRYAMSADFELMLGLALIFGIDAWLRARAGWGPFSVSTTKTWVLGEKKIDSGLKLGVRAPLRYASDEPFQAPSWGSIQFIKPTIDFSQLLDRVISSAPTNEKKD
jgi:hypothetical protein